MESETYFIVDKREMSTPVSTWTQYLCICKLSNGNFELSVRKYDVIGDPSDYSDDNGDNYSEPSEINGKKVVGVEDGYIVGGDLISDYDDTVEFKYLPDQVVTDYLIQIDWSNAKIIYIS